MASAALATEERQRRTLILLDTYLDYLPSPYRSSVPTSSGPAPSRSSRCDPCLGTGKLAGHICPVCDGHGRRKRRRGDPVTDDYTGQEIGTEQGGVVAMSSWQLDAEIGRIERATAEREDRIAPGDELPWLRKKQSMRRHGDYEALERALLWLRLRKPLHFAFLWKNLVLHIDVPNRDAPRLVREGVVMLAGRMPDEIRIPRWLSPDDLARARSLRHGRTPGHTVQRGERNTTIRVQYAEGRSTTWLAVEHNLSRRMIQHILRHD